MKKKLLIGIVIGVMALNVGCFGKKQDTNQDSSENQQINQEDANQDNSENQQITKDDKNNTDNLLQFSEIKEGEDVAIIKTNMGDIKVRFFKNEAPKAVENFITHAKNGYYNNVTFHRVIKDFMIQGGDPTATGTGGESIWGEDFENEVTPKLRHFYGALSMANTGSPKSNGSQFFIVENSKLDDTIKEQLELYEKNQEQDLGNGMKVKDIFPENICQKYIEIGGTPHLDGKHTVFGQVYEGMDIVEKIANTETVDDKPVQDVVIKSIEIMPYKK